jgi:hypothetical protein
MDSKSVRNMSSSLPNKVEKWRISLAFIIRIKFHVLRLSICLCFVYYTPTNDDTVDVFSATLVRLAAPPRTFHIDFETEDREPSCCAYKAVCLSVSTGNRLNIKPAKSTANHDVLNKYEDAITTNHAHRFSHRVYDMEIRNQY